MLAGIEGPLSGQRPQSPQSLTACYEANKHILLRDNSNHVCVWQIHTFVAIVTYTFHSKEGMIIGNLVPNTPVTCPVV